MRFGSRDLSEFSFLSDTSPKYIDREDLGDTVQGRGKENRKFWLENQTVRAILFGKLQKTCPVILDDANVSL